jgi:hypothetical protein
MPGDITTASGTRVFIGPAATSDVDTLVEFAALSYTEIGLVESISEFGDESADVAFAAIGDSRTRHAKGARDAGTMTVVCAHDPTDVGQAAFSAAQQTNDNYAFRVILSDSPTANYSDTNMYFRGLVRSAKRNIGTNDNVIRNTYAVGINSPIVELLAAIST